MKHYSIYITDEVKKDVDTIYYYIAEDLMSPIIAHNYRNGISQKIKELASTAGIYALTWNDFLQSRYGTETRMVRYKKMAIIYNIIGDKVIVRRVIPGSLIK